MTAPELGLTSVVSIIVPVRDGARFLGQALASIHAQTYRPLEVLVVDDASSDESGRIAEGFDGVRVLRSQEPLGPAGARDLALDHATGELVAFVDADDLVPPDKVELQAQHLWATPGCDVVLGKQEILLEPDVALPEWLPRDREFDERGGVPPMSAMARRDVLDAVRFDPSLMVGEWRDWLFRVREAGYAIEVMDEVVLTRRVHEHNLSHRRGPMRDQLMRSLQRKIARSRRA